MPLLEAGVERDPKAGSHHSMGFIVLDGSLVRPSLGWFLSLSHGSDSQSVSQFSCLRLQATPRSSLRTYNLGIYSMSCAMQVDLYATVPTAPVFLVGSRLGRI